MSPLRQRMLAKALLRCPRRFVASSSRVRSTRDGDRTDALLDVDETLRSPLPRRAASLAAAAFALYRRRGGVKQKPLPNLFIGAHAAVSNPRVLTRDPAPHANRFARLAVVSP